MAKYDICYDLDGVIHSFKDGWTGDVLMGKPVKDAKWAIELLLEKGKTIIILTTRKNISEVKYWLLIHNFPDIPVTNKKPIARIYVDDRGVRFTNHQDIIKYVI